MLHHLRRARAGLLALAALAASALCPAAAAEHIDYLFAAPPNLPAFAPYMIAKYKGYYTEEGLDITWLTGKGGVDNAKQLGAGNADLGGGIGDTSMIVRPNGVPVKTVALVGGRSLTQLVTHADLPFNGPADLKGRTILVMAYQDTTYYSLLGMLASAGLTKDDVTIQAVGPVNIWKLFVARQGDAMAAVPEWIAFAEEAGAKVKMVPSEQYFPSMPSAIMASDHTIATRPEMIRKFVRATLRAEREIMADPVAAAQVYIKAVPEHAGKEHEMTRALQYYATLIYPGQTVMGATDEARLAKLQDFYVSQGVIKSKSPLNELYTNEFVQ